MTRRGELVSALLQSDYGKPRPAFGRLEEERMKAVDRALLLVAGLV